MTRISSQNPRSARRTDMAQPIPAGPRGAPHRGRRRGRCYIAPDAGLPARAPDPHRGRARAARGRGHPALRVPDPGPRGPSTRPRCRPTTRARRSSRRTSRGSTSWATAASPAGSPSRSPPPAGVAGAAPPAGLNSASRSTALKMRRMRAVAPQRPRRPAGSAAPAAPGSPAAPRRRAARRPPGRGTPGPPPRRSAPPPAALQQGHERPDDEVGGHRVDVVELADHPQGLAGEPHLLLRLAERRRLRATGPGVDHPAGEGDLPGMGRHVVAALRQQQVASPPRSARTISTAARRPGPERRGSRPRRTRPSASASAAAPGTCGGGGVGAAADTMDECGTVDACPPPTTTPRCVTSWSASARPATRPPPWPARLRWASAPSRPPRAGAPTSPRSPARRSCASTSAWHRSPTPAAPARPRRPPCSGSTSRRSLTRTRCATWRRPSAGCSRWAATRPR